MLSQEELPFALTHPFDQLADVTAGQVGIYVGRSHSQKLEPGVPERLDGPLIHIQEPAVEVDHESGVVQGIDESPERLIPLFATG